MGVGAVHVIRPYREPMNFTLDLVQNISQSKANTNIIPVLEHMASYFPSMLPDPCGLLPHRGGV